MKRAKVTILKTSPSTVLEDYRKLLHLAEYQKYVSKESDTLIKHNLSWTKYFPACSSQPWQVEGVVKALVADSEERCQEQSLAASARKIWSVVHSIAGCGMDGLSV